MSRQRDVFNKSSLVAKVQRYSILVGLLVVFIYPVVALVSGQLSQEASALTTQNFSYTGAAQTFTAPQTGTYQLEVWGAYSGGYSIGTVSLNSGDVLYVYAGGAPNGDSGGFNGGGDGDGNGGGGGASDIRINTDSAFARVIVAGGGSASGDCGGGSSSCDGVTNQVVGSGGFGCSTNGSQSDRGWTGGGGGWYCDGGGRDYASGGSGWVYTAPTYSYWVANASSSLTSGWLLSPSYYLSNASTTSGNSANNGYAKITQLTAGSSTPTITSITPDSGPTTGGQVVTITGTGFNPTPTTPTTMQQMTQAYCASMTVYNGINTTALLTLSDTRGGSYTVGKLADGNCWMLDNLKLGSTTGTMALTSNDTDLHTASNPNITNSSGTLQFTLPQLITSGSSSYDNPGAYGPVTGDTSTGSTNYGYLYNWPAATAGESRTTMPNNSGNAPNSICPAGWHMPTGGSAGEFAWLNAKMNNVAATSPSTNSGTGYYQNFQFNGPFRGVSSGYWFNSFNGQGDSGNFWSSSTYPDNSSIAFRPYFGSSYVHVDDYDSRVVGYSVRCLATGGDSTPVVDFGGTAATVVSYTDTSITVTTPAHAAGKVDVDVSVNGVAAVPSVPTADDYTYVASISITAITPNHGLEAGGTSVTISGANFGASEPTASTTVQEFGTCGASQQVTLPAGTYRLEAWGAQGGYRTSSPNNPNNGGKGGYSAGDIVLTQAQTVQVNVGCSGNNGGWNGGGARTGAPYPGGGGGTDIRIGGTALTDRIVVAGGGGSEGGDDGSYGGYGGGLNGGQGRNYYGQAGTAGTQTAGGTGCTNSGNCTNITSTAGIFGRGGDSGTPQVAGSLIQSGGAGGGGWFGGGGSSGDYSGYDDAAGGAGGSGYVFTTSSNKTGYGANIPNIQYYLSNTSLVAGNTSFAAPGGGNETGHSGDGYVRITPQTTGFFPVVFDTGGTPAPCLVSSWTDTQIVCTTSAHVAGLVSVTITNPNTSATLPAVYTNPSGDLNDPANVSSGFLYQPIYVELQPIASTNLSIAPGSAGSVASSSSQGISTKTNNPTGYSLSLYTTDANSRLANTANSSYYISPVGDGVTTGILSNPIALPANTWGFAIPKTTDGTTPDSALVSNDFDNSYTSVTSQSGYTAKYAKVPTSALTVKNTTSANGELPSNTSIYYAANVDLTRQAGTYKATVVYTVTARP